MLELSGISVAMVPPQFEAENSNDKTMNHSNCQYFPGLAHQRETLTDDECTVTIFDN